MPDTLAQWALFTFYTIGSAGGIGFIGLFAYDLYCHWTLDRKRRRAGL